LQDDTSLNDSDLKGSAKLGDDDLTKFMSPGILPEIMNSSKRNRNRISGADVPFNIRKENRTAKESKQKGKYEQPNGSTPPFFTWKPFKDLYINKDETQIKGESHSNQKELPQQEIFGNYRTVKTSYRGNELPRSVFGSSGDNHQMILRARKLISGRHKSKGNQKIYCF